MATYSLYRNWRLLVRRLPYAILISPVISRNTQPDRAHTPKEPRNALRLILRTAGTRIRDVVTLTPNQSSAAVILKLVPKPGVLVLSVKDELTGESIISFLESWAITDSDNRPSTGHSGGQTITQWTERAPAPPEKHLLLTISVDGYKKWIDHDPSDPSRPAFLHL